MHDSGSRWYRCRKCRRISMVECRNHCVAGDLQENAPAAVVPMARRCGRRERGKASSAAQAGATSPGKSEPYNAGMRRRCMRRRVVSNSVVPGGKNSLPPRSALTRQVWRMPYRVFWLHSYHLHQRCERAQSPTRNEKTEGFCALIFEEQRPVRQVRAGRPARCRMSNVTIDRRR